MDEVAELAMSTPLGYEEARYVVEELNTIDDADTRETIKAVALDLCSAYGWQGPSLLSRIRSYLAFFEL